MKLALTSTSPFSAPALCVDPLGDREAVTAVCLAFISYLRSDGKVKKSMRRRFNKQPYPNRLSLLICSRK